LKGGEIYALPGVRPAKEQQRGVQRENCFKGRAGKAGYWVTFGRDAA